MFCFCCYQVTPKIKCISENSNIIIIQRLHVWAIMQILSYCQSIETFPRIPGTLELIRLLISSFECHLARGPPPAQTHAKSSPPLYIQVALPHSCPAEWCSAMNCVAALITEYKLIYVQFCKLYMLLYQKSTTWLTCCKKWEIYGKQHCFPEGSKYRFCGPTSETPEADFPFPSRLEV